MVAHQTQAFVGASSPQGPRPGSRPLARRFRKGRHARDTSAIRRKHGMKSNLRMLTAALSASAFATAALAQHLRTVHFKASCTPRAQEKFDRGVALVHSFYYPDSVQAFTEAAAADPQCAIAYWGIAISHRPNPLVLPLAAAALKNGLEAVEK